MKEFYGIASKAFFDYVKRNQNKIFAILDHVSKNKSEVLVGKNPINYILLIKIEESKILITDRALNPETLYTVDFKEHYFKITNQDNSLAVSVDILNEKIEGGLNVATVVELLESIMMVFDIQIKIDSKENNNLN